MPSVDSLGEVSTVVSQSTFTAIGAASDVLIILILVGILLLFAMRVGRGPFIASLLAFYASYGVFVAFPFISLIPTEPALTSVLARAGIYLVLTILFYIILRRVVVSDFLYVGILGQILLSVIGAGFIMAMAYHVFNVQSLYTFSPTMNLLFAAKEYFFWWFIGPAVGLFFIAR